MRIASADSVARFRDFFRIRNRNGDALEKCRPPNRWRFSRRVLREDVCDDERRSLTEALLLLGYCAIVDDVSEGGNNAAGARPE